MMANAGVSEEQRMAITAHATREVHKGYTHEPLATTTQSRQQIVAHTVKAADKDEKARAALLRYHHDVRLCVGMFEAAMQSMNRASTAKEARAHASEPLSRAGFWPWMLCEATRAISAKPSRSSPAQRTANRWPITTSCCGRRTSAKRSKAARDWRLSVKISRKALDKQLDDLSSKLATKDDRKPRPHSAPPCGERSNSAFADTDENKSQI